MKMVDVNTEIVIALPRETVAAYAAHPDHAPEWYVNIQSAEWKTEKPLQVGSQIAFLAQFLGRKLAYVYEIVEYEPGHKLVMRTADGPFPMETTYTWESVDPNATYMRLRNRGTPTGFAGIFSFIMAWAMKRANRKDLKHLKQILENRESGAQLGKDQA